MSSPCSAAAAAEKLLLASSDGRGFVTPAAGAVAETRKGKQIVNLRPGARLKVVRPIGAGEDYAAVVGENRKLVVYPLAELPELGRGQGVQLQRYRDGGLSDATTFNSAEGLSWAMGGEGGRTRTERHESVAHRARRGRADAAAGLPARQQVLASGSESVGRFLNGSLTLFL